MTLIDRRMNSMGSGIVLTGTLACANRRGWADIHAWHPLAVVPRNNPVALNGMRHIKAAHDQNGIGNTGNIPPTSNPDQG